MNNIFLAPRAGEQAQENFKTTITDGYDYNKIEQFLNDEEKANLKHLKKLYIWGATKESTWRQMETGDFIIFYTGHGTFTHGGKFYFKTRNKTLADGLWGVRPEGGSWEYVYFLVDIFEFNLPITKINNQSNGTTTQAQVMGFMRVNDITRDNILNKYGTVEEFFNKEGLASLSGVKIPTKITKTNVAQILEAKKQIILYGPPGTGKTYKTKEYAVALLSDQ